MTENEDSGSPWGDEKVGSQHERDVMGPSIRRRNDLGGLPDITGGDATRNARLERGPGEARQEPLPIGEIVNLEQLQHVVTEQVTSIAGWEAPMPAPATLLEYEKVLPGAAERILRSFEAVTVDASARDDRLADAEIWVRKTGAGWAYALLFFSFVAAVVFFALGNNYAGWSFLGAPILLTLLTKVMSIGRRPAKDE